MTSASLVLVSHRDRQAVSRWAPFLLSKATVTDSPERNLQTGHRAKPQRTLGSQWESPRGRHSVGDKTLVTRTAPRVSRPPTLARIQADGSNFPTSSTEVRGKQDKREAKGWDVGEAGADRPPLPTYFSRGCCSAGKPDQPSPERPDQSHFLCN